MIEVITAAAFALAWFAFRYERHRRWRSDLEAAHGTLKAVHHGMVQGLTPGQAVGWGQIYFSTIYTQEVAHERARQTFDLAHNRMLDYVLPVPTEPLARLATVSPHPRLIESSTVAVANFALWRVHAFNHLVENLANFLTANATEITSADTDHGRRHDLANAANSLSVFVHQDGVGEAWALHPGGSEGWYRALVTAVLRNMTKLEDELGATRWRWVREWPFVVINALAVLAVAVVTLVAACDQI